MKVAAILFLLAAIDIHAQKKPVGSFDNSRTATPEMPRSVGVRGAIDGGGYAASATAKTQSGMFRTLAELQVSVLQRCSPGKQAVREALAKVSRSNLDAAAQGLEAAIKIEDHSESRQLLALIYEASGRLDAAVEQFRTAAQADRSPEALFAEVLAHLFSGDVSTALSLCRQSNDALSKAACGAAQFQAGEITPAIRTLLESAENANSSVEAGLKLLVVALPAAPPEVSQEAAQRLSVLTAKQGASATAHLAYATAMTAAARSASEALREETIEQELRRALQADPQLAEAYLQRGAFLAAKGRYQESIAAYEKALELDGSVADAHYRLGQVYSRTGQPEKGRDQLHQHADLRAKQRLEIESGKVPIRFPDISAQTRFACP